MSLLRKLSPCVAISLVCLSVGCGPKGPTIATVEGTITMDGQPLANASVVFIPDNGRPAGGWTDEKGYYTVNYTEGRKGAIPGPTRVRISTKRDPMEGEDGKMIPGSRETVPAKYNTQTELSFNVEEGKKNVANFDLDSKGKVRSDADSDDNS